MSLLKSMKNVFGLSKKHDSEDGDQDSEDELVRAKYEENS